MESRFQTHTLQIEKLLNQQMEENRLKHREQHQANKKITEDIINHMF